MINSRLFQVLHTLSAKEWRLFSRFINSSYFNENQEIVRLWQFIECRKNRLHSIPDKETVLQQLFPKKQKTTKRLDALMNLLLQQLEAFLVIQTFQNDDQLWQRLLAGEYRRRKLEKPFKKAIRKGYDLQHKSLIRNAEYFQHTFALQQEEYKLASSLKRMDNLNLQELSSTMDLAYITQKLRHACLTQAHQMVANQTYKLDFMEELIVFVQREQLLDIPAVAIYFYGYQALKHPEKETNFTHLKMLVLEHHRKFPQGEIRDIFLMAINYCIKKQNTGKEQYSSEALDLYQMALDHAYLLEEGLLSRFSYHNCTAMAIIAGEFQWSEQFIEQYKKYLPKEHQEASYIFNRTRLEYYKKNYDTVLKLLSQTHFSDLLLNLSTKVIQLKTYYELGEYDLLQSHLDALRTFINRKKMLGYHKTNYQNIIKYTQKLVALNPYDRTEKDKLETTIQAEAVLTEKKWLLGQLKKRPSRGKTTN